MIKLNDRASMMYWDVMASAMIEIQKHVAEFDEFMNMVFGSTPFEYQARVALMIRARPANS